MDFRKSVVLCVAILVLSALVRSRSLFRGLKWATTDCRSAGEWVAPDLLHFRSPPLEGPTEWSFVVDGLEGAAMWLPPGVGPDVEEMMRILDENANEQTTELLSVLEQMGGYHPSEACWYLPLIGVDPAWQGRGFGAQLLRHATALCVSRKGESVTYVSGMDCCYPSVWPASGLRSCG